MEEFGGHALNLGTPLSIRWRGDGGEVIGNFFDEGRIFHAAGAYESAAGCRNQLAGLRGVGLGLAHLSRASKSISRR